MVEGGRSMREGAGFSWYLLSMGLGFAYIPTLEEIKDQSHRKGGL